MKLSAILTLLAALGLGVALSLTALTGVSFASAPHVSQESEDVQLVTVRATGSVVVTPSHYSIDALLKTNADLGAEALEDLRQVGMRMDGALEASEGLTLESRPKGMQVEYMPEPKPVDNNNRVFVQSRGEVLDYGITLKEGVRVQFTPAEPEGHREAVLEALDTIVDLGLELEFPPSSQNNYAYINGRRVDLGRPAVLGELDAEAEATAERAAKSAAMARARALADHLASDSNARLGAPQEIVLETLDSKWLGVDTGLEFTATVKVSFQLLGS